MSPIDANTTQRKSVRTPAGKQAGRARVEQLLHVVSFKFKDAATAEDIRGIEEAFRGLRTTIPQIRQLVWGLNNSPEGLNKGCTHVWVLTFDNEKDRDAYLVHPDHRAFGERAGPLLADVFVVDFWAKE